MAEEEKKATAKKTTTAKKASAPKATKASAPKAAAPKAEAPKEEAPKAEAPKASKKPAAPAKELNRVLAKYKNEVVPALIKEFGYTSIMQAPRFEKIVINIGVGDATSNGKALEDSVAELTAIAGQKPVITKARKSIANFKLREGMSIGCKVTLRGDRMYEFLDKLMNISLPRVRDFRGVSPTAFDGRGNYTLGVKEQLIFPEINFDKVNKTRGMDIVIVTTAKTNNEAFSLLKQLGMPFAK